MSVDFHVQSATFHYVFCAIGWKMYCMPQRVGQHHIISCAEPCTATKFLHLLDNVDSALKAIRFGNFLVLLAGNIGLCVFVGAFW